jgi:hypothetical protein
MAANSAHFHIQLDGVTLTAAQSKALAADLDKLVSSHIAKLDFRGEISVGRPLLLNPEWLGIWLRNRKLGTLTNVPSVKDIPNTLPGIPQSL